jgi:hypothetical protein
MAESVSARIRYVNPDWRGRTELPRISSRETRRANTRFYDVRIEDARPLQQKGELDLDTNGFVLVQHASGVEDFQDAAEVSRTYYPRIEALVQRLTGASQVVVHHHQIRTEDASSFNQAYARIVHCDFSHVCAREKSRKLMVERSLCTDPETEQHDYAWYTTWQPFDREVQQNPLALIDASSLEGNDIVDFTVPESGSDTVVASMPFHSPKHRHYYFPRMQTNELIVLKQLDTRPQKASLCPHTSFDDPTAPANALPRRSIEARTLCVFPRTSRH